MSDAPKRKPVFVQVNDLRPGTSGHNLTVKVIEHKLVVKRTRQDGSLVRIAECIVGDQSGIIVFTARNQQVDVMGKGAYVNLRNAKIDMFKGSMRVAVDKWGVVEEAEGQSFEPDMENNLSLVEYELVTVPVDDAAEEAEVAVEASS